MDFVLDTSVAAAWAFKEERTDAVKKLLNSLNDSRTFVPPLWQWEIASALEIGIRRKRVTEAEAKDFFDLLRSLPIIIDPLDAEIVFFDTFSLSRTHALTVYDAAYLELAMRKRLPLATQDKALNKAAKAEKVKCLIK